MMDIVLAATGADETIAPLKYLPHMIAAYVVVWGCLLGYVAVLLMRLKGAK